MAIIRHSLGNNRRVIEKKFRNYYTDGLGGIRFETFCTGWKEGFEQLQAEKNDLVEALKIINRGSLSEMRQYCIKNNIHKGISDFTSALLMIRISESALQKATGE